MEALKVQKTVYHSRPQVNKVLFENFDIAQLFVLFPSSAQISLRSLLFFLSKSSDCIQPADEISHDNAAGFRESSLGPWGGIFGRIKG